jgi:hypothetical protein
VVRQLQFISKMKAILAGVFFLSLTGCTIVGAGLGALTPKYEAIPELEPSGGETKPDLSYAVGAQARLYDRRRKLIAHGIVDRADAQIVHVHDGKAGVDVPTSSVARAEKRVGDYAELGGVIGLIIDASAALTLLVVGVSFSGANSYYGSRYRYF